MNNENEFNLNGRRYVAVDTTGTCEGCAFEGDETGCDSTPPCSPRRSDGRNVIYVELPKPETNGDWIRGMSNEKLADFLSDITDCVICPIHDFCRANKYEICCKAMLHWMNSPLTKGNCK